MKISVIIPTYKPAEYIWECLDSLEKQTFSKADYEVILVLNGCKEPYYSTINDYIARSEVQYNFIQTDQGGVSNARNIGLDNAKGEYITFIDDDDIVSPKYLEGLCNICSKEIIALSLSYRFSENLSSCWSYAITEVYNSLHNKVYPFYKARRYFSGPCMKLFHRDIIGHRRFDKRYKIGEDSVFMFLISDRFRSVCTTSSDAVYYRRIRIGSTIMEKGDWKDKVINAMSQIVEYIKIYSKSIRKYNFMFCASRILATILSLFVKFK